MWQDFESVLGQPAAAALHTSHHPGVLGSNSSSTNNELVSERLNGLQQTDTSESSTNGHLSAVTESGTDIFSII